MLPAGKNIFKLINQMMRYLFFCLILIIPFAGINAQIKLEIDIYTGDDNLEKMEFQENPEIRIILNGKPDVIKKNINGGSNWNNNSIKRITMELPANVSFQDLAAIHLRRDRKGSRGYVWDYLKKDNWTLKGIVVNALITDEGKVYKINMLNKTNQRQLYRFTYDGDEVNPKEGIAYKAVFEPDLPDFTSPGGALVKNPGEVGPKEDAMITAVIGTGSDNLEGGNDNNINLEIRFKNSGRIIRLNNINQRQKWNNNTERTLTRVLENTKEIDIKDIGWVVIRHTGGDGSFADNWNMSKLKITISKDNKSRLLVNTVTMHRFTGNNREKEYEALGESELYVLKNATITAVFGTGDDNLEGGSGNNVNIIIRFNRRTVPLTITNINNSAKWDNNSVHTITKELNNTHTLELDDIKEVEVRHTGGSGTFADNWNLVKLKLTITKDGITRELVDEVRNNIHRFTGNSRKKVFLVGDVITF
jgi:hypothetical protein